MRLRTKLADPTASAGRKSHIADIQSVQCKLYNCQIFFIKLIFLNVGQLSSLQNLIKVHPRIMLQKDADRIANNLNKQTLLEQPAVCLISRFCV